MPHQAAGSRTEPPVSVPMATGASPAATATPDPLDEPPGSGAPRDPTDSGRTEMGVGAEAPHRKLHGVRLAEDDHAGRDEPLGEGRGDR